jgi:hypothetical protein
MFADSYHKTHSAALDEVQRRRDLARTEQLITRIEKSPYGGYRVRSVPAEFILDHFADSSMLIGGSLMPRTKAFV